MAGKNHGDSRQVSKVGELARGCQRASQLHKTKVDSEAQRGVGSGTPHHPQPASLQCPGASGGAGVYRVGIGTEPSEGSEGPLGAVGMRGDWARPP